ncbi:MAG: outer membrane protein assembly factor BamB family protein [Caulobacteraceae bacterium]
MVRLHSNPRSKAALRRGLAVIALAGAAVAARAQAPLEATPFASVVNHDAVYEAEAKKRSDILAGLTPLADAAMRAPAPGDWLMWRRTYDGQGFSPLTQIDRANAAALKPAFAWSLANSPNEVTPVVHDGVLFVASGGRIEALDGASGVVLWRYVRPRIPTAQASSATARSIAIYDNLVIAPTPDRHVVALDMKTGKVVWDQEVVPASVNGPRLSGGPIVAHGKVIQGVSSCNGVKGGCYIVGLDAKTGKEAWRFYSIARPGEPGGDSWNGAPLEERFGGSVWNAGSYDPDLNLVYVGIAQTYDAGTLLLPHPQKGESSDGLYTDSTVALDPDTGRVVWHYQHFNREVWDYDWSFERVLVDLPGPGGLRKMSVTGGKIAIFDAIDRKTGQYLFSRDLGIQTLVKSIDPKTGRKIIDPQFEPAPNKTVSLCPHAGGAKNWLATSYEASTHTLFIPLVESCMDFTWKPRSLEQTAAGGSDMDWLMKAPPNSDGKFGRVEAVDLATGKVLWTRRQRAAESSSLLATAGGVLFEGSRDRQFRALDARSGKVLWSWGLNAPPSSTPITYTSHGQQYVAVVAGGGNPHDLTWRPLTPEIDIPADGVTLWVFKVPAAGGGKKGK